MGLNYSDLNLSMDELLCSGSMQNKAVLQSELTDLLAGCSTAETKLIIDMIKTLITMKKSMQTSKSP